MGGKPNHIKLDIQSGFYNPFWYNRCQGREFIVDVSDGKVVIDGEIFIFDSSIELSTVPKKVIVYVGRNITCVDFHLYTAYADAQKQHQEKRAKEEEENLRRQRKKLREEADAFNKTINLPVPWHIGFKDVLSGLCERSDGSGMNKATVYHVTLLGPINIGRLKREKFNFLCTAASGTDGKDWSGCGSDPLYRYDGDGNRYTPKPTCKACLKLLERFASRA